MAILQLEKSSEPKIKGKEGAQFYHEQIGKIISHALPLFERQMKRHLILHGVFCSLIASELFFLVYCLSYLVHYSFISWTVSALFLTTFSYAILFFYFQTKKQEQWEEFQDMCIGKLRAVLNYREGVADLHQALASGCCKFAESLKDREYHLYSLPSHLRMLMPSLKRLSCHLHWRDVHAMRELFLKNSVREQIKKVKCQATDYGAHASLANAYVVLSSLYTDFSRRREEEFWSISKKDVSLMEEKFRRAAECAIEEFKILNHYAPHDPWVHEQLAYTYRDLQMPLEEIHEYELILQLIPGDVNVLYKLGVLYFQLGRNGDALAVYKQLRHLHYKKGELLISHYGAYRLD